MSSHQQQYTVVTQQHTVVVTQPNGNGAWQHTLCGCCDDMKAFMCSWCCPCIAVGKVAEKLGKSCGAWGCLWVAGAYLGFAPCVTCVLRGDVRQARGIEGGCCGDFCGSMCCHCCVLAQMFQEVGAE